MLHQAKKSKSGEVLVKELQKMECLDPKQFLIHLTNFCDTRLGVMLQPVRN